MLVMLFGFVVFECFGQDVDLDILDPADTSILVSVAGQNGDQVTALAASIPIVQINGFANGYISRQVAGGEVTSEVLYGRIQGAYDFDNGMSLEAFYAVTRNKWRGIGLQNRIGWFYRPGIVIVNDVIVSGGIGTFSQNQELLEEIGKDVAGEGAIEFGPLTFATAKWRNVIGRVQANSTFRLKEMEVEGSATISEKIADGIEVGFTSKVLWDQGSVVEENVHTEYMAFLKIVM